MLFKFTIWLRGSCGSENVVLVIQIPDSAILGRHLWNDLQNELTADSRVHDVSFKLVEENSVFSLKITDL